VTLSIDMPPIGWDPQPHQMNLWNYFNDPITFEFDGVDKRAVEIAHRRWGKDEIAMQIAAKSSIARRATYWHMLPEYQQARKAIWNAVNPMTGIRRIDEMFPMSWRANTNDNEMFIRFKWGATWQVVGSDNFKSLVGASLGGITFSEWSKAHPGAWAYLAPILTQSRGWALFITTPEGRNHAHSTYEMAKGDTGKWFAELQTVEDSSRLCRAAGVEPPMTLEQVEQQRKEYHAIYGEDAGDAMIQQEFWCSWTAAILGAYWGKEIERAEREERICDLDIIPHYPVSRAWDIGVDDPMAIWCYQVGPGFLHVVDYIEGSGYGFDWYANQLGERGYLDDKRAIDWVPHDAKQREPGSPAARTRIETMATLRLNPRLVPDHKPIDRINAGRRLIPRVHFDAERCKQGLECLRNYKADWDPIGRTFRKTAKHDWSSHGSDAWGHLSVAVDLPAIRTRMEKEATKVEFPPITVNQLIKYQRQNTTNRKWE
jgi:phage terminase large subunit